MFNIHVMLWVSVTTIFCVLSITAVLVVDVIKLTHSCRMKFLTVINWICPFVGFFYIFIQILKDTSVSKQWRT